MDAFVIIVVFKRTCQCKVHSETENQHNLKTAESLSFSLFLCVLLGFPIHIDVITNWAVHFPLLGVNARIS